MPCKFELFCIVNNLCNLSADTFPHLIYELAVKPNGTATFMNIGRLSNDDGEGNENVPSYQNECAFFLNFHFNSLKMANIGQLRMESWRSHPSSDSEKKFNLPLCLRPPNNVAKGNLRLCSHSLYRKTHWTCKICCFSFTYWAHCRRRHRRLCRCSQDLLMCVNG